MAFIETSTFEKRFSAEREKLKDEVYSTVGKDPKALDKYKQPRDNRKSVGTIAIIVLIAAGINLILSLLLAALMDVVFPNYDTMPAAQRDTITTIIYLSMLVLPIVALIVCILKNKKNKAELDAYKALQQTPEYREAVRIQNEYNSKKAAAEKKLNEFDERNDPYRSMGLLYIDGGKPSNGSYMGDLYIDGNKEKLLISYHSAPYEILIPNGTSEIMIKSGQKIVWKEDFYFSPERVYTVDIAGSADSAELSVDLDRYSDSGRSDIRYQKITRSQYRTALRATSRKPRSYVFEYC